MRTLFTLVFLSVSIASSGQQFGLGLSFGPTFNKPGYNAAWQHYGGVGQVLNAKAFLVKKSLTAGIGV